jgi:hypothetical protein
LLGITLENRLLPVTAMGSRSVNKIASWAAAIALVFPAASWAAPPPAMGWPEVIALLAKARTQATACVQVLKSNGDKAAIGSAQLTYGMAEGEMDGVIAGLATALVQGGSPDILPTARTSLETAGKGLKEICDAASKTVAPNTKGVWKRSPRARSSP